MRDPRGQPCSPGSKCAPDTRVTSAFAASAFCGTLSSFFKNCAHTAVGREKGCRSSVSG